MEKAQAEQPEDTLDGLIGLYRPFIQPDSGSRDKTSGERQDELQSRTLDATRLLRLARRLGSKTYSDRDPSSYMQKRTETLWSLLLRGVQAMQAADDTRRAESSALWQRVTKGTDLNKLRPTFGVRWEGVPDRLEEVARESLIRALGASLPDP